MQSDGSLINNQWEAGSDGNLIIMEANNSKRKFALDKRIKIKDKIVGIWKCHLNRTMGTKLEEKMGGVDKWLFSKEQRNLLRYKRMKLSTKEGDLQHHSCSFAT